MEESKILTDNELMCELRSVSLGNKDAESKIFYVYSILRLEYFQMKREIEYLKKQISDKKKEDIS